MGHLTITGSDGLMAGSPIVLSKLNASSISITRTHLGQPIRGVSNNTNRWLGYLSRRNGSHDMTTKLHEMNLRQSCVKLVRPSITTTIPIITGCGQGQCPIDEIRAWALNRFCYQRIIPVKDALIMARLEGVEDRREWRQRVVDHDGEIDDHPEGGLRRWLALTSQLGFSKDYVMSMQGIAGDSVRVECLPYLVQRRPPLRLSHRHLPSYFLPTSLSNACRVCLKTTTLSLRSLLRTESAGK